MFIQFTALPNNQFAANTSVVNADLFFSILLGISAALMLAAALFLIRSFTRNLLRSTKAFDRAVDAKQDYASAHYLMAQAALRLGNVERAIKGVEGAKLAAPFDIGVAFQLGLLYYQTADFGRARGEFERAVSLNENYSNARYFLGLIYDRQNEKERAIAEFERVLQLNPGNQEVIKIIANLREGKQALSGIVPPNEAPEKRKETPVR